MIKGILSGLLVLYRRAVCALILTDIELFLCGAAEARVHAVIPLHGRPGAGPVETALHGSQTGQIAHADLVAVIDKRCSRHGQQKGEGHLQILLVQPPGDPFHIVVAGGDADQPLFLRLFIILHIFLHKLRDVPLSLFGKVGMLAAEQVVIMRRPEMKQKIHVEAALQGLVRLPPLGNQHGVREFLIQERAHLFPEGDGSLSFLVLLHQRTRHIHTEAVTAHLQPEAHHILHGLQRGLRPFVLRRHLPWPGDFIIAVIQRGLGREKIHRTGTVPVGNSSQARHILRRLTDAVRPYVTVRVFVFLRLHGFPKPGMFHRSMSRNQIQQHMHAPLMRLRKQPLRILVGAVSGRNGIIVRHIIAGVPEGGYEAGIQPEGVAAQLPDIIQLFDHTRQIPDSIAVGVQKGLGIDFIKNRIVKPFCHFILPPPCC